MTLTSQARPLALVTGGHRRLGAAISIRLATDGYDLALHGSHDVELEPALASALENSGVSWHGFVADFSSLEEAGGLVDRVAEHFGRGPDLLVNSAAIFGQDDLTTVTPDDLTRHYAINCAAPVLLTRAFAALDETRARRRCIVNILDQRLAQPHGDQLSYTLSKMSLAGFTRIAARTLAPRIRVNAVAPGLTIVTDDYSETALPLLARRMPLERLPRPEDIASAVSYLAGAGAVTGQTLTVDCGAHMISFDRDFMHLTPGME